MAAGAAAAVVIVVAVVEVVEVTLAAKLWLTRPPAHDPNKRPALSLQQERSLRWHNAQVDVTLRGAGTPHSRRQAGRRQGRH